ncbi:MAG: hypothetical protein ABI699_00515 [Caldimonas sp.]
MHALSIRPTALALALLAGCTYLDERRDLNAGGPQQREAAAAGALAAERQRSANLSTEQARRERELGAINARLATAQAGLDEQTRRLDAALKSRQISASRYAELKRQADALKSDTASLKLRNDADRASKASTSSNDPAKLQQIETLDKRRKDLEAALQAAVRQ